MNKIIIVIVVLIVAIGIGIFYELGPFLHPSPSLETTAFSSALSGSWVETYNQTYTSSIINSSNVSYYPGQQSLLKQQFNLVGSAQSPISVDISVSNFNSTSYAASVLSELTSAISNSSSFICIVYSYLEHTLECHICTLMRHKISVAVPLLPVLVHSHFLMLSAGL